jgi:LAO/AO transport system kinase
MYETINEQLRNSFYNNEQIKQLLDASEKKVLGGECTSFAAAQELLEKYFGGHYL